MGISNSLTMSYLRATFDEQELSKKAPSSQYLHKWIFDFVGKKQTLTIFRINEKIKYLLEDFTLVRTYEGTIDKMIPRLIDSQPEITEKNEVIFSPKQEYLYWELKDKKISLLRQKDDLIYQIFDRTLNVSIQTSMDFTEFGYIRWVYPLESLPTPITTNVVTEARGFLNIEIIKWVEKTGMSAAFCADIGLKRLQKSQYPHMFEDTYKTNEEKVSVLKNFEIVETPKRIEGKDIEFSLQPKWIRSKLDPTKIIDYKNWAITVINTDDMWPGHAVIIIESIEEGQYFMYKAHIGGDIKTSGLPAKVSLVKKHLAEDISKLYGNFGKTETFSRPSCLVKLMIERIEWEKNMKRDKSPQVYFSQNPMASPITVLVFNTFEEMERFQKEHPLSWLIHRSRSINAKKQIEINCKQDTCITWVTERLKIAEIKLGAESLFLETPRSYTNPDRAGAIDGVVDFVKNLFK